MLHKEDSTFESYNAQSAANLFSILLSSFEIILQLSQPVIAPTTPSNITKLNSKVSFFINSLVKILYWPIVKTT
jgi:hypothetical protein